MLQRRPTDGAKAMQRALLLKRQKQAFIEAELEESADDLPTESDLAFINGSAGQLRPLENPTAAIKTSTESAEDSFPFIQDTELNKPTLKSDDWMDIPSESQPSEASACIDQPEVEESSETALGAINDSYDDEGAKIESVPTKPLLKLARPRKEKEAADGLPKVRVFTKSGRVLNPVLSPGSGSLEPSSTADAPEEPSALPASEIPAFKPQMHEGTSDEFDVYEDQAQEIEYSEPIGLNTPDAIEHSTVLDESDDDIDFENDLLELSIFEPEEGAGDGAHSEVDDFREIEDEYAAYVYDPDEVFESEEAASFEADYWLAGRVSREERALQKAAELIGKANWPHSTLSLVQQIFVMSGWGATRLALEREIEKGLTPDELILAAL